MRLGGSISVKIGILNPFSTFLIFFHNAEETVEHNLIEDSGQLFDGQVHIFFQPVGKNTDMGRRKVFENVFCGGIIRTDMQPTAESGFRDGFDPT